MRRLLFAGLLFCVVMLFLSSVSEVPLTSSEMRVIVEANGKVFSEGVRTRDFERIAALYTENAKYGKDDEDFLVGRAAIREDWKQFVANPDFQDLILEPASIQGSGSVIYETGRGRTVLRPKPNLPAAYKFKYVNVWVRQADGTYKLDVDFYNGLP